MTDSDLLRKFVAQRDQDAFRQIVDRHIDMVYSAAVRQSAGSNLADDVTQAVFIVLAKKAHRIDGTTLAGWLVNAARLLAKQAMREEWRRKNREKQAALMKEQTSKPADWDQVSPIVDEALSRLGKKDRTAVTLRYLEGRELSEVAATMGVSEGAAAKRLTRAMAKMRKAFSGKSVQMSSVMIGTMLLDHAKTTAPEGLAAKAVSAAALGKGAAAALATAAAAKGTAATASSLAHAALGSAAFTFPAWGYAVVTVVAVSLAVGGYKTVQHFDKPAPPTAAYVPTSTATIRVGILISQFTAAGPHNTQTQYGYKDGYLEMYRALRTDPMMDIYSLRANMVRSVSMNLDGFFFFATSRTSGNWSEYKSSARTSHARRS
jgi:RNA polymerase sigma factor (sigma-70 family)